MSRVVGTVLIVVLTMSCGVQPRTVARVEAVAPSSPGVSQEESEYTLRYGDVVDLRFLYHPELNETLVVRPDGRVTIPKLKDVHVAGLTPMQVDSLVMERLSKSLGELEVNVTVRQPGVQNVYVLGEVGMPGVYPLTRRMTVLQALATARGALNTAQMKSVMLIRKDPAGRPVAQRLDLTGEALERGEAFDAPLAPLDIVYVPKTFIAQVNLFLEQHFTRMLPLLYLYLVGSDVFYPGRR